MRRQSRSISATVTGACLLLIAGPHAASSQELIHACVRVGGKAGSLRIVSDSSDCEPGKEQPLSWNQAGPQGPPGMDGEPGPEGPSGSGLRVFDADGNTLGIPWSLADPNRTGVLIEGIGLSMKVEALAGDAPTHPSFVFELDNCQGQAYLESAPVIALWTNYIVGPYPAPHPTFYAIHPPVNFVTIFAESILQPDGTCSNTDFNAPESVPAVPFTGILPFPFPAARPFYVGLEPPAVP